MKTHLASTTQYASVLCGESSIDMRATTSPLEVTCRACRKAYERDAKKQRRREKRHD